MLHIAKGFIEKIYPNYVVKPLNDETREFHITDIAFRISNNDSFEDDYKFNDLNYTLFSIINIFDRYNNSWDDDAYFLSRRFFVLDNKPTKSKIVILFEISGSSNLENFNDKDQFKHKLIIKKIFYDNEFKSNNELASKEYFEELYSDRMKNRKLLSERIGIYLNINDEINEEQNVDIGDHENYELTYDDIENEDSYLDSIEDEDINAEMLYDEEVNREILEDLYGENGDVDDYDRSKETGWFYK